MEDYDMTHDVVEPSDLHQGLVFRRFLVLNIFNGFHIFMNMEPSTTTHHTMVRKKSFENDDKR